MRHRFVGTLLPTVLIAVMLAVSACLVRDPESASLSSGAFAPTPEIGSEAPPTNAPKSDRAGTVTRVVDGDTIDVLLETGVVQRVRLIGIDTPETVAPGRQVQCFGREATARMTDYVLGRSVELQTDSTQGVYDRSRRLLAYVFQGGRNINDLMVRTGYAREYTYRRPYEYQAQFKLAEQEARALGLGLWSSCLSIG